MRCDSRSLQLEFVYDPPRPAGDLCFGKPTDVAVVLNEHCWAMPLLYCDDTCPLALRHDECRELREIRLRAWMADARRRKEEYEASRYR